jgi:hypothetical protein
LLQFAVRDDFSLSGFGGENAGDGLFIDVFFGRHCETAGKLLVTDGRWGSQKGQERADLLRRQGVDDFMKSVQVAHDLLRRKRALRLQYIERAAGLLFVCVKLGDALMKIQ